MRRGTTPAIALNVNKDLTGWTVQVAIRSGKKILTLENDRLTMTYANGKTHIEFTLTQEETLGLSAGRAAVQVRAVNSHGVACASDIEPLPFGGIIKEGILE